MKMTTQYPHAEMVEECLLEMEESDVIVIKQIAEDFKSALEAKRRDYALSKGIPIKSNTGIGQKAIYELIGVLLINGYLLDDKWGKQLQKKYTRKMMMS